MGWPVWTVAIGLLTLAPTTMVAQTRQQVVNPAPVNYWMDVSTGQPASGGGLAGMMGGMMGGGGGGGGSFGGAFGGNDNWFGAAQTSTAGRFTDIAIFDRRQAGRVSALQAIPSGMRMGSTLPLLAPPPPEPNRPSPWDERTYEPETQGETPPRITLKYYWGCGATVRQGQPRVVTFDPQNMRTYGEFVRGRSENDRGATSNNRSSIWPNRDSHRAHPDNGSLVGPHSVTGAGLPSSLAFQIPAGQDFMPPLGLRSSGSPTGVLSLSWTALPTASAYFANANGFEMTEEMRSGRGTPSEMVMIMWSAAETGDPGDGLIGYLSNANQDRFLADRTLLGPTTTTCQIPAGIFAQSMMVNIQAVGYGRELNLVHPPRPTDVRVPWNQEWTARIRVKSQASLTLMPGMGGMGMGSSRSQSTPSQPNPTQQTQAEPSLTPEQLQALPVCRGNRVRRAGQAANAIGGLLGGTAGGLLGRAGNAATNLPPEERPGQNCRPQ